METLRAWVLALCAGGLLCGAARTLTPKGRSAAAVKLACGFLTLALLIGPVRSFDFSEYARSLSRVRAAGESRAAEAAESGSELLRAVIESECEAYILDKAAALGIGSATARVTAESKEEETPWPYSVLLGGEADDAQRSMLSRTIEGELGIPAERQHWSVADEN